MPYISAKLHRERIARAELGRHLCSAQWLNTWTCENGLQQCRAWSGRPQGSPLSPWHISSPRATARVPTPLHTAPALTMTTKDRGSLRIIVRAGAVWSGVGTLAVALGGKRATLTSSSPYGRYTMGICYTSCKYQHLNSEFDSPKYS